MKNLLSLNKKFTCIAVFYCLQFKGQNIANYVANGSFEDTVRNISYLPLYWSALDTSSFFGLLFAPPKTPKNNFGYQWPRHGNNYLGTSPYFVNNTRGYPRNRLKQNLRAGKTYCVTYFVSLTHLSPYGIDALGAYFGNHTLDTIRYCNSPITYLTPQVNNPTNNIITDTLNWVAITGTFVATGSEKYMLLGNFKSDTNTNLALTNPTNIALFAADYYIDAVSCIEADVAAYAGPDKYLLAGDSVYIGRERDFAVDPYCVWYQLPNTISIDTTSGIWVKPMQTTTYVVQQNLECGSLKWDTVVVRVGYTGNVELEILNDKLKIYPTPANEMLNVVFTSVSSGQSAVGSEQLEGFVFEIINSLGQVIREEELVFREGKAIIDTKDLESGVYVLLLKTIGYVPITRKIYVVRKTE